MLDAVELIAEAFAQRRHRQPEPFKGQRQQRANRQSNEVGGNLRRQAWPDQQRRQARDSNQRVAGLQAGQGAHQKTHLLQQMLRRAGQVQAEQILDLQDGDDDADAGGEAQGHRIGHEFDQTSGAQQAQADQDQPGHQRAQQQSAEAVLLGNRQQYHHEGGGGAGDVEARAAAQGDQGRGDQHGIEAVLRCHAHRDGQRHGQWNGDDAHRQAGAQVSAQGLPRVTGAQRLAPGGEQR